MANEKAQITSVINFSKEWTLEVPLAGDVNVGGDETRASKVDRSC